MSQISSSHPASKSCVHVGEMEAAYKAWLQAYSTSREPFSFCLYHLNADRHTLSFKPVTPFGNLGSRRGIFHSIWHGISSFSLFPYTDVMPQRCMDLTADDDAILNDWVVAGSDLYNAYRGCKILAPHDPAKLGPAETSSAW
jgi:hypothetical protein